MHFGCCKYHFVEFIVSFYSIGMYAEITQIAAVTYQSDQHFSKYVMPRGNISTKAADITGLTVERTMQGTRILVHNGRREPIQSVLPEFIAWLKSMKGNF